MCHLYILHSLKLDKFYVGHTCIDMEERLEKHLTDHDGYTSKAKDWIVVYQELFADKSLAYKRELEIKSWKSSKIIKELIHRSSAG